MSEHTSIGDVFHQNNQTFASHFDYLTVLAGILVAFGLLMGMVISQLVIMVDGLTWFLATMLLATIVHVKVAVMVHRLVILKEKNYLHLLKWGMLELKFLGYVLTIIIIVGGVTYLFVDFGLSAHNQHPDSGASATLASYLVLMIALTVMFSRLALIFPATAAGHPASLSAMWHLSSEHKFVLFFLVVMVPFLTGKLLEYLPDNSLLATLLSEVIAAFIMIYEVGLLSHIYDALKPVEDTDNL